MYPPGSTFKPFMALAGLELGKRTPDYTISDPGYFYLGGAGHMYRDWKKGGHGMVNLHRSIVISCDTYYYGLAQDLGIDAIHSFIGQFGLGRRTGIDIDGESTGLLPSQAWKMKRFKQKWYGGDTISIGIGQGYNLATPVQLAFATAILANRGIVYRPHLVQQVEDAQSGERRIVEAQPFTTFRISEDNLTRVRNAMVDVNRPGGTASAAFAGAEYAVAGKTGTAQVIGMKAGEKYDESRISERYATTRSTSRTHRPSSRRSRWRSSWKTAATVARSPVPSPGPCSTTSCSARSRSRRRIPGKRVRRPPHRQAARRPVRVAAQVAVPRQSSLPAGAGRQCGARGRGAAAARGGRA
jgi:cell division protein FtsI/penicillin-binding protein 2